MTDFCIVDTFQPNLNPKHNLRVAVMELHVQLTDMFSLFVLASESESDVSPEKRARVGDVPEGEESSSSSMSASSSTSSRSGSKQRSRKRCHRCQTKLELVQQELGSCRCGTMIQLYTYNTSFKTRILTHDLIYTLAYTGPLTHKSIW